MESNKSPVKFEAYANRRPFHLQPTPQGGKEGPVEARFEDFNTISYVNSKYSKKDINMVRKFSLQTQRRNEKREQIDIDDN